MENAPRRGTPFQSKFIQKHLDSGPCNIGLALKIVCNATKYNPHMISERVTHAGVWFLSSFDDWRVCAVRFVAVPLCLRLGRVQLELNEDYRILHDRPKGPQQPWQGLEEIRAVLRVRKEAGAVGQITSQRQEEEKQGEA